MNTRQHKLISEALGTALLLIAVVGSGIGAQRLAGDQAGLALLIHALVIGGVLVGIILALAGSSAHFNPAVSLFFALQRKLPLRDLPLFWLAQIIGGITGVLLAHIMFELPLWALGEQARWGAHLWVSEFICTFALLIVINGAAQHGAFAVAAAVGAFIAGAIFCFSSASFANPAVTIARCLTNSYAAIRPHDVLPYCLAQLLAAFAAAAFVRAAPIEALAPEEGSA